MMKNFQESYFDFSRNERRGIAVLTFLMVLFITFPYIYSWVKSPEPTDFSDFEEAVKKLEAKEALPKEAVYSTTTTLLFPFNPNTLSRDSFQLLGLKANVINNIINYRNKGGQFFKPSDLKKIYSLSEEDYLKLQDFIEIPKFRKRKKPAPNENNSIPEKEKNLTIFDPNTADKAQLTQLGLTPKVVNTIINFRNKGGRFYKKEDLQKIYGLSLSQYQELYPYIKLVEKEKEKPTKNTRPPAQKTIVQESIDINQSTAADLQKLKGIGPYYSKRIVTYRDHLGGYASIEQLTEIYGFPDSVFQKIKPHINCTGSIDKINLNKADYKTLAAHPYFTAKQAKIITKYRKQHGAFAGIEDLMKTEVVDEKVINKIRPYLEL